MSNIIYRGINSDTITGLLISELPDISRPTRRTEVIEVDGRDGDVYNYLGYESYKKTLQVGLYADFNIDQVSNFFSGDGDLILSNEATKKYSARIVDGIDFERLVRFRKAKVVFLVQPYKKLASESVATASVSPMTVTNPSFIESKPTIILTGVAGTVITLKVNTFNVMTVTIPPEGTITLDGEALNCYNTNADKNQYVVGDFAVFKVGANLVEWVGSLTNVTIIKNSRWL